MQLKKTFIDLEFNSCGKINIKITNKDCIKIFYFQLDQLLGENKFSKSFFIIDVTNLEVAKVRKNLEVELQ